MVVLVVLVYVLVASLVVPGLIRRKEWRELAAFAFLHLVAVAMSVLYALGLPLPNITYVMQRVMREILHLTY